MARFVFSSFSHCKPLFLVACITAFLFLQAPLALAQRGAHFGGGGRFAASPHVMAPLAATPHFPVSPSARTAIPPFRFSGSPRLTGFRASGVGFRPRPIHPRPVLPIVRFPVFFGPFFGFWPGYGFNSLWWPSCNPLWGWGWGFGCNTAPYASYYRYDFGSNNSPYVPSYISPPEYAPPPSYLYGGDETRELPELYLKDGTVYRVTDYWLVNGQIHFTTLGESETKSVEHFIPFEDLDLQQTIDVNTRRGFRFVLRNAPVQQFLRNRNEGDPPAETAPPQKN